MPECSYCRKTFPGVGLGGDDHNWLICATKRIEELEATGAAAVQHMQEKLDFQKKEARRLLAAVVMATGGSVEVMRGSLTDAYDAEVIVQDSPRFNGITVSAKRKD